MSVTNPNRVVFRQLITANVKTGGSFTVNYPANAPSDPFDTAAAHTLHVEASGAAFTSPSGFTVKFGSGTATITYLGATTIPAQTFVGLDFVQKKVNVNAETWATRIRRLRTAAKNNNPIESPRLIGSIPWTTGVAVNAGDLRSNAGLVYQAAGSGTTGATPPTGAGNSDDTVTWFYVGKQTAPVITAAAYASHNASYTNNYLVTADNYIDGHGAFRWRGGAPTTIFGSNVEAVMVAADQAPASGDISGTTFRLTGGKSTFVFEGTICEVQVFDNVPRTVSIIVDGRYIDGQVSTTSSNKFFTIDFTNVSAGVGINSATGVQKHEITIEWPLKMCFSGVRCLPTHSVSYPQIADNFSCAIIGDSQIAGSGDIVTTQDAFANQLMHLMGLPDMMLCGIGGTGIVAPNASTPYIGHAVADLRRLDAFRPLGLIIVQHSQNDINNTAGLPAAALALFKALRAAFPSVPILVQGMITGAGINSPLAKSTETIVANTVTALQNAGDSLIYFYPCATDPQGQWISGTGNTGATTGSGNSDINMSTDNAHLNSVGHTYWARRCVKGILDAIANVA
jgi:hypothetical protein